MNFKWLSIVTGFFYMVLGVFIVIKQWFFVPLEEFPSYALGALMVIYGVFRIGRAVYRLKQEKYED